MITSVKKLPNDKFLVNDTVVVYNLDFEEKGISFTVDYDEKEISEEEATRIAEKFVNEALENAVEKANNIVNGLSD